MNLKINPLKMNPLNLLTSILLNLLIFKVHCLWLAKNLNLMVIQNQLVIFILAVLFLR